jgi:DNA-directed RNA polymerase I, II, and III subunit RPABC2
MESNKSSDKSESKKMPELEPINIEINNSEVLPLESKINIVPSELRVTDACMTSFEYCAVVSIRATHIANSGPIFIECGDLSDPTEIAKLEIKNKRCPLLIMRTMMFSGNQSVVELWKVNEMAIPE